MSDLDKAIRDHLTRVIDETMERRNGLTSILPGTEMSRVLSAVQKLIDDHKPIGIYEECGHSHRGDEPGVREFDGVGLVCDDGLMYEVCASCCDWNPLSGQTEHCVTTHDHHHGDVHCMVVYSVSESLGVSGEDRSEPTPAPREQWAVEHPDVITTAHNSPHSVLYTASKLPGGVIVTRADPDQPWVPEVRCLCGDSKPADRHYTACPDTPEVVTPEGTS